MSDLFSKILNHNNLLQYFFLVNVVCVCVCEHTSLSITTLIKIIVTNNFEIQIRRAYEGLGVVSFFCRHYFFNIIFLVDCKKQFYQQLQGKVYQKRVSTTFPGEI